MRTRTRTRTRVVIVAAVAVLAVGLSGCSGPHVIGAPYHGAGPGALATDPSDNGPAVGWVRPGERFFVTTYGSSSCPTAPTAVDAGRAGPVVTMTRTGGSACTADSGPASYALDLPRQDRGRRHVTVTLRFDDDDQPTVALDLPPVSG